MTIATKSISLEEALVLLARTVAEAHKAGAGVAIVVTDQAGQMLASARMDGVNEVMLELARRKALTSAAFGAPSGQIAELFQSEAVLSSAFAAVNTILPLGGGLPILADGVCIGAVGLAGGHYSQDEAIAKSALVAQEAD